MEIALPKTRLVLVPKKKPTTPAAFANSRMVSSWLSRPVWTRSAPGRTRRSIASRRTSVSFVKARDDGGVRCMSTRGEPEAGAGVGPSAGAALSLFGGAVTIPAYLGTLCRFGAAAVSPLFLYWLFNGQAQGVPPLDKGFLLMMKRYGEDAAFLEYDRVTPRFLPTMASFGRWLRGPGA